MRYLAIIIVLLALAMLVWSIAVDAHAQSPADHWRYVCWPQDGRDCWYVDWTGAWNMASKGTTLFDFQALRLGWGWVMVPPEGM